MESIMRYYILFRLPIKENLSDYSISYSHLHFSFIVFQMKSTNRKFIRYWILYIHG